MTRIKQKITQLLSVIGRIKLLRNKYAVAIIIFMIWILFLDENNLMAHHRNKQRLKALKEQKVSYRERIEEDKRKLEELRSGTRNLEKYAREEFHMTKPDEELFLVIEK